MVLNNKKSGLVDYFKSHPILTLIIISPGIPEYLSGSSALNSIVLNPPLFFLELAANLGLYVPGVLLIREAKIRWQKGWATVLLLGAAYGILEEGISLSTLFNPKASPVGKLGIYGHWLGVNWIWSGGIVGFHAVFSIAVPILLLGLGLPETNGKSLLKTDRSLAGAFAILFADVVFLFLLVFFGQHFWMGAPVMLGSFVAILVLVYLARKAPANALIPSHDMSAIRPFWMGVIGASYYPSQLLIEYWGLGAKLPSSIDFLLVIVDQLLYLSLVLRVVGRSNNERILITFVAGLLVPVALFGVVSEFVLPVSSIAVVIASVLLVRLWKKYPVRSQVPEGEETRADIPLQ